MKPIKLFLFGILVLLLAACSSPLTPVTWTPAQKAAIDAAIASVDPVQIGNFLTDPTVNIKRHVTEATPGELAAAEATIMGLFSGYGLSTQSVPVTLTRVDSWDPVSQENVAVTGTFTMNNLIATKAGTDTSLAPVLVTAHWDSMPQTVGMDDNGSGCAGVLEIARVLQGLSLERTVVFILFAFEEEDMGGSHQYVSSMTVDPHMVIDLEMIGFTSAVQNALPLTDVLLSFPTVGNFIGVVASDFSKDLGLSFCTVADAFVPDLPTYMIGADANLQNDPLLTDFMRSDHIAFWEKGVPAIMVTDTSFLREGTPYHTAQDTFAKLDLPYLVNVTKTAAALTILAAGLP